jgi:hypothetical protein
MRIVRTTFERLNTGGNRDRKATLNQEGRDTIIWLFDHAPSPPNVLLQLDHKLLDRIMALAVTQVGERVTAALPTVVYR